MAVTIFIKRTLKDKTVTTKLAPLLIQLRSRAAIQPGFLTSQTYSSLERNNEYLIRSTWDSLESWNIWMNSEERMAIQRQVDDLLGEKTIYQYYEAVAGGIPPKFRPET
jgi:heme-degrading monooxygenase HmoA